MDRLELVEELAQLEKDIKKGENMLNDLGSGYFRELKLTVDIHSKDYNRKTDIETCYKPDQNTFVAFLQTDLNVKKNRARKILEQLIE